MAVDNQLQKLISRKLLNIFLNVLRILFVTRFCILWQKFCCRICIFV